MVDFRAWWGERKLRRQRRDIIAKFKAKIAEARTAKNLKLVEDLQRKMEDEDHMMWEELDLCETNKLCKLARKYDIALPPHPWGDQLEDESDIWWRSTYSYEWHLSQEGRNHVRTSVRTEKNARIESYLKWLPLVTALTALFGVLTGLIAVWRK